MFKRRLPLLLAGILLLIPAFASAQQNDRRVRQMLSQAMESYQGLEVDQALNQLRLALRLCNNNRCSPAMQARVHVAIGIVTIGGQNDAAAGIEQFESALRLDPSASVDPTLETPEITQAFNQARQRVGGAGGSSTSSSGTTSSTSSSGRATVSALLHTPAPEQLENTPLPVYVEHGHVQAARFVIHYRGLGMSGYSTVPMERIANGYGGEVPCGQVIAPYVEYYVTAEDDSGRVIAAAGTPQQPVRVNIVHTRTQPAPALPGRMPREQCGEDCPPGMTGPQCRNSGSSSGERGQRQLGDPCSSDSQCATGLHCQEGSCATGERSNSSGPDFYRFGIDLGGGIGLGYLQGNPAYAELRDWDGEDNGYGVTCGMPSGDPFMPTEPYACPRNITPGFAPMGYLHFGLRFNVIRQLGIAVTARFQPDAASVGTLPFMLLGARAYLAVTSGGFSRNGLVIAPFVGGGFGQIQPRPGLINGNRPTAHVVSGLSNAHAGGRIEYGFGNIAHVAAEATLNFQFTSYLFDIDLHALVGLHF